MGENYSGREGFEYFISHAGKWPSNSPPTSFHKPRVDKPLVLR